MKHEDVRYFFVTSNQYWSKAPTFFKAFTNIKEMTSKPCECIVYMTTDTEAYIDEISGGVCTKKSELCQLLGKFKFSQGRLTPVELKKS